LNLHTRLQFNDSLLLSLPISIIQVSGNFEIDDAMTWLNVCLPDVPIITSEQKLTFGYKSSFLGTLLQLTVTDKQIKIKTDNLSVLAIIKDSISACASQRKVNLNVEMS
jgi:Bardet-Biedl syndrome 7 protein